jgi:hypothetical protein
MRFSAAATHPAASAEKPLGGLRTRDFRPFIEGLAQRNWLTVQKWPRFWAALGKTQEGQRGVCPVPSANPSSDYRRDTAVEARRTASGCCHRVARAGYAHPHRLYK